MFQEPTMTVDDPVSLVLGRKNSSDIWFVSPLETVYSALKMMADKDVGALLVMENDQLAGVVSERDYARKVVLLGRGSKETPVREIMNSSPITIRPDCTVDEAMRLIVTNRIRHLPVVRDGKILGMISIGDLVNWIAFVQEERIQHLESYIHGGYPS
jgi:CBS domain-containing protein